MSQEKEENIKTFSSFMDQLLTILLCSMKAKYWQQKNYLLCFASLFSIGTWQEKEIACFSSFMDHDCSMCYCAQWKPNTDEWWAKLGYTFLLAAPDIIRDAFRNKNGIMWEKFPRGQTPPPLPQYGNFFDEIPFFSEDVPKWNFF